jgi:hypothetical protein
VLRVSSSSSSDTCALKGSNCPTATKLTSPIPPNPPQSNAQAAEFAGRVSLEQEEDADIRRAGYCVASSKVREGGLRSRGLSPLRSSMLPAVVLLHWGAAASAGGMPVQATESMDPLPLSHPPTHTHTRTGDAHRGLL